MIFADAIPTDISSFGASGAVVAKLREKQDVQEENNNDEIWEEANAGKETSSTDQEGEETS